MSKRRDTRKDKVPGFFLGGLMGGSSPTTNQNSTYSNEQWTTPYFYTPYQDFADQTLQNATKLRDAPYEAYDVSKFGPMSNATQQQAWDQTKGLQGSWNPLFDKAQGAVDSGGYNFTQGAADAFTKAGQQPTALEAANPWTQKAGQGWTDVSSQYLNPYINDVIKNTQAQSSKNFLENVLPGLTNSFVASGGGLGGSQYDNSMNWALTNFNDSTNRTSLEAAAKAYNDAASIFGSDAARWGNLSSTVGNQATAGQGALTNLGNAQSTAGLNQGQALANLGTQGLQNNLTATNALLQTGNQQQEIENWKKNFEFDQWNQAKQWPYQTNSWGADVVNKFQWPHAQKVNSSGQSQSTSTQTGGGNSGLGSILGALSTVGSLAIPGAGGMSALGNIFGSMGGGGGMGASSSLFSGTGMTYRKGGKVGFFNNAAKTAVHKHERNMHPGKPLTKLARGGYLGMNAPSTPPFVHNPGYFKWMDSTAFADGGKIGDDLGGILGGLAGGYFLGPLGSIFGKMGGQALGGLLPFATGGHAVSVKNGRRINDRAVAAARSREAAPPGDTRRPLAMPMNSGFFNRSANV